MAHSISNVYHIMLSLSAISMNVITTNRKESVALFYRDNCKSRFQFLSRELCFGFIKE